MKANRHPLHRIFFALWPAPQVQTTIAQCLQQSAYINQPGTRAFQASNLHLTLHFIGGVTTQQLDCYREQAEHVQFEPFELTLDQFGDFHRAKILWLGPTSIPSQLHQLHSELSRHLIPCGYTEEKRAYCPHVSLLRKFSGELTQIEVEPISWRIDRFALVESISQDRGVVYQPLRFYTAV